MQPHDILELPPFTLKDKGKTPICNEHNAFQHNPYPHPPSSVGLASSAKTSASSTKMASLPSSKSPGSLSAQFEELDCQCEMLRDKNAGGSHSTLRFNFAIHKQELDNQCEEHIAKQANAEVEFMQEQELRKLDIWLKEQEVYAYEHQIEMLCLQIQYQHSMLALTAGSSSTTSPGLSSSSPPFPPICQLQLLPPLLHLLACLHSQLSHRCLL